MRRFIPALILLTGCGAPLPFERHELEAVALEQTYTIDVFVPPGGSGMLSTVYLLDGDYLAQPAAELLETARLEGSIAPVLLVAVGYGPGRTQRARDYTPPSPFEAAGTGGVEAFHAFLEDELIPFIDARYPTVASPSGRTLAGHSLGGIGALWGLFHPASFEGFAALSPSLYWGHGTFFELEAEFASTNADREARVFLAAGQQEAYGLAALTEEMGRKLESRDYPGLQVSTELLPRLDHAQAFGPGFDAAMRELHP